MSWKSVEEKIESGNNVGQIGRSSRRTYWCVNSTSGVRQFINNEELYGQSDDVSDEAYEQCRKDCDAALRALGDRNSSSE